MSKTKEILTRAKALISTPESWARGELATGDDGASVPIHDSNAQCFCALGAIARAALDVGALDAITLATGRINEGYRVFDKIPGTQELADAFIANGVFKFPVETFAREPSCVVWNVNDQLGAGDKTVGHDVLMCLFDSAIRSTE